MRRFTAYLLILMIVGFLYYIESSSNERSVQDAVLDTPSPGLGRVIATSIHQAVTDPYFAPLEKLAGYLNGNPDRRDVSVGLLSKWATDDDFPTCFILDPYKRSDEGSRWQTDQPVSPWVLEAVLERIRVDLVRRTDRNRLAIVELDVEGESWWLGYLPIYSGTGSFLQIAGVFFSLDRYIERDVPRLINTVTDRSRFPLISFQQGEPVNFSKPDGLISLRILDERGEVYLQRGRTFEEADLIYSESKWYPNPVVCLQKGWDLQVFSSFPLKPEIDEGEDRADYWKWIIALVLVTLLYWWGAKGVGKPD